MIGARCRGLALLLASACASTIPAEPPGDATAPAIAPAPAPVIQDETPPAAPAPTQATMPERFAALGSSCADVEDGVKAYCDRDGRAVGLSAPVDLVFDIPWQRIDIAHEATGLDRGAALKVGFVGEQLWVVHVSCGICRRVIGAAIVAELDRLTDEQRRQIQDEAGLPRDPVLRSADDWRRTLAPQ